jgi:hypothetical protein
MILGFKKQFVPLILNGTKIHTIREDQKNRWKVGMKIHMATGVRTKEYNQFAIAKVTKIDSIAIAWHRHHTPEEVNQTVLVYINENRFSWSSKTIQELVKNDGFNTMEEFFEWFNEDFTGKIIHWELIKE